MQDDLALPKSADFAPSIHLIERYVAGECTPDEQATIARWAAEVDSSLVRSLEMMREKGRSEALSAQVYAGVADAEQRLLERIGVVVSLRRAKPDPGKLLRLPRAFAGNFGMRGLRLGSSQVPTRRRGTRVAVTVALSVCAAMVLFLVPQTPRPSVAAEHRYETATGQQADMTLLDGTRVTLAPRSILRVVRGFGQENRTILLEGEAYFNVTQFSGRPFVVHTGAVNTRVLGTEFVVRRYAMDAAVRVSVVSGKVVVATPASRRPSVTLVAGHVAEATDSTAPVIVMDDRDQHADWRSGSLVFDKTPTTEVLATLSRWYGYEFRITDSTLSRRRLTAVLSTQSSREALSTLKALLDVELLFDRNVVTLTPRRDDQAPVRDRREAQHDLTPNRSEAGR